MTTFEPLRHRGSSFLHRNRSSRSVSRVSSPPDQKEPIVFEGTDAVTQNREVAVQRIVEVHNALEAGGTQRSESSGSILSADSFDIVYDTIPLPNAEVRAFRYFLRKWDPSEPADSEFDHVVRTCGIDFETLTIKHFFRRIALWYESEEVMQVAKKETAKRQRRERKERKKNGDSALGKIWLKERESHQANTETPLKEVTTREGLAQLLWTLMHDYRAPLAPELFEECTKAVERKYGMAV